MADVFISYSKQDHDEARLLAAFLEAEGYSVWWDASLVGGEQFRKVIMTELGRARAAIVIWTENSIESDWVQSEAGRAHADRKLIPVKTKGLAYKDIPPPFDNMHIENLGEREKILGAVVAQLAKPEAKARAITRIAQRSKFELLTWFGIIGAVLTLTTNIKGLLTLGHWAKRLLDSWADIVVSFWRFVLFFLPEISRLDALILTFVAFVVLSILTTVVRRESIKAGKGHRASTVFATVAVLCIFAVGLASLHLELEALPDEVSAALQREEAEARFKLERDVKAALATDEGRKKKLEEGLEKITRSFEPRYAALQKMRDQRRGIWYQSVDSFFEWLPGVSALLKMTEGGGFTALLIILSGLVAFMFVFFGIPLLLVGTLLVRVAHLASLRIDRAALSLRLWRIVIGVAAVVALSYLSVWIEQQPWAAHLMK